MKLVEKEKGSSVDLLYKEYTKTIKEIAKEEEHFKRELKKEEDKIREYIKEKYSEIKDTFEKDFTVNLDEDTNGQIFIRMKNKYSIIFHFEIVSNNKEFLIKINTRGEAPYKYSNFIIPNDSTVENYMEYIDNKFTTFLTRFNLFISKYERDQMFARLSQEVKKP